MSKSTANFVHALVAVMLGNAGYFLAMRFLPVQARHAPFHFDLGLLVDFCFCAAIFAIIKMFTGETKGSP